jgi:hypothetical protein
MPKKTTEAPQLPLPLERAISPISVSPDDAPRYLGISKGLLERYVKEGKMRGPVQVPGSRRKVYILEHLRSDWESLLDGPLDGDKSESWSDA